MLTVAPVAVGLCSQAMAASITLNTTVRDFKYRGTPGGHPNFEYTIASDPGIVQNNHPASKKPVYAELAGNSTINGVPTE